MTARGTVEDVIRAGEKGVSLVLRAQFDCTGMSSAILHRVGPSGVQASDIDLEVPSGDDLETGTFRYLTQEGDFDAPGSWRLTLEVNFGANQRLKSRWPSGALLVEPAL